MLIFKPRHNCLVWFVQREIWEPEFLWYADFKAQKFSDGPHYEQFGTRYGEFNRYRQGWGKTVDGRYVFTEIHHERRSIALVAKNEGDFIDFNPASNSHPVLDMASQPPTSKPDDSKGSGGQTKSRGRQAGKRNK